MSAAVIGDASGGLIFEESRFSHTMEVDVAAVEADPAQARRNFDDTSIFALAATLKTEGQLQPILVRRHPEKHGRWIIVAGERRWRAAKMLRWPKILAMVHGGDADVVGLIENLQRVDLSPLEEARGIGRLIREKGWTQDQAARALGKPKSDISGTLRILDLPEDVLTAVVTSDHPPAKNVLVEMARIDDRRVLRHLVDKSRAGTLTVKAVRASREVAEPPPAPSPPEDPAQPADPWRTLRKARRIVRGIAASGAVLSLDELESLRDLRDAIDQLLGGN